MIGASAGPLHVLHVVDTLDIGGAERVAVNVANVLPRQRFRASLCTTRRDGPLADLVNGDVGRLRLQRTARADVPAVRHLVNFIQRQAVRLLHAHGTALFLARVASLFPPFPAVVWHDHFGRYATEVRPAWLYRAATAGIGGVISVNRPLAAWARHSLHLPADRVWYVPNFVATSAGDAHPAGPVPVVDLPGTPETRVVAVANFRRQKDHATLVAAFERVLERGVAAHLLLVGEAVERDCLAAVERDVASRGLGAHVSILGPRRDVPDILRSCAVGVLSSSSEGLPLSLVEYGAAGLAVVATDVGECAAVLDHGRAGVVVQPSAPAALAGALIGLLESPSRRALLGARLLQHVRRVYGQEEGARQICAIYDQVLRSR